MTRADVEAAYKVRGSAINSPGKFEGEPIYAPYYYEEGLNGAQDVVVHDGETPVDIFYLCQEDRAMWPELGSAYALICFTDEQGFTRVRTRTKAQIEDMVERLEQEEDAL